MGAVLPTAPSGHRLASSPRGECRVYAAERPLSSKAEDEALFFLMAARKRALLLTSARHARTASRRSRIRPDARPLDRAGPSPPPFPSAIPPYGATGPQKHGARGSRTITARKVVVDKANRSRKANDKLEKQEPRKSRSEVLSQAQKRNSLRVILQPSDKAKGLPGRVVPDPGGGEEAKKPSRQEDTRGAAAHSDALTTKA